VHKIELCPKSRKIYDKLTRDQYVELENWEFEGRKEYKLLLDYAEENWPERLTLQNIGWPDEFIVRSDVRNDADNYCGAQFRDGALALEKTEFLPRLRQHGLTVNTVTVNHIFSIMRKQQQIVNGYLMPDRDANNPSVVPEPVQLGTEKIDDFIEFLEDNWPRYKTDVVKPIVAIVTGDYEEQLVINAVKKHFKFTPKVLNGATKGNRVDYIKSASEDPLFVVKAQAGAESVDMRWSRTFLFLSKTPDSIQFEQLLARNMRGGQTEVCTYIHFVAANTVDERIEQIVWKDLDVSKAIKKDWRALL
jgi:hypothetical protein